MEKLESIATIFALVGGILSVIFAVWGVYREWDLSRKEKAEELLNTLVDDLGEHFIHIEDTHGWNIINDHRNFSEVTDGADPEQLLALQRAVRKLLRQLESISIRIKHGLLDEQICKDYMASISVQVLENCKPFIDSERLHRSDNRIFEHFERTANRWRL